MTDYSDLIQPDKGQEARIIHLVDEKGYDDWLKSRSARERAALAAAAYKPKGFAHAILPTEDAAGWSVVTTVADAGNLSAWSLVKLGQILTEGRHRNGGQQKGQAE